MTPYDARNNEFQGALDGINNLTLTENRTLVNTLNALNSNVVWDVQGKATLFAHLNVSVAFNAGTSLQIQGTIDGTNFLQLPFFVLQSPGTPAAESCTNILTGIGIGNYLISCSCTGFKQIRAIITSFTTAGTVAVAGRVTQADYRIIAQPQPSLLHVTLAPALATGGTLTLPAAGAGLFHYITAMDYTIAGSATAQTAGAAVFITTTNLPGSPAWGISVPASTGGFASFEKAWFNPLKSSSPNTATTFVAPVPGSQSTIRLNVSYYTGA